MDNIKFIRSEASFPVSAITSEHQCYLVGCLLHAFWAIVKVDRSLSMLEAMPSCRFESGLIEHTHVRPPTLIVIVVAVVCHAVKLCRRLVKGRMGIVVFRLVKFRWEIMKRMEEDVRVVYVFRADRIVRVSCLDLIIQLVYILVLALTLMVLLDLIIIAHLRHIFLMSHHWLSRAGFRPMRNKISLILYLV